MNPSSNEALELTKPDLSLDSPMELRSSTPVLCRRLNTPVCDERELAST
jgi:hypothetical protein